LVEGIHDGQFGRFHFGLPSDGHAGGPSNLGNRIKAAGDQARDSAQHGPRETADGLGPALLSALALLLADRIIRMARRDDVQILSHIQVGLAASNLAELEVAKRNQVSDEEPP
jgi:hypothetical protein